MQRRSLPPARTIRLFARTIHRQLRQAGYDRAELVAHINELLDLILSAPDDEPLSGISDSETNVSNRDAVLDGLAFEMRRARELGSGLVVIVLSVVPPDWCTDEAAWALHARVAKQLRRGVRPADVVGRIATNRYALALPGATRAAASEIVARLVQPLLVPRRNEDRVPEGTRVLAHVLADDGSSETAEALLDRCAAEPAHSLSAASVEARVAPRATSVPPPPVQGGLV